MGAGIENSRLRKHAIELFREFKKSWNEDRITKDGFGLLYDVVCNLMISTIM